MTHHQAVLAFNHLIVQRKFDEALEFYAEKIVVTHNTDTPVKGINDLKHWMNNFVKANTIESIEVVSLLTEDSLSVTNWYIAYTDKQGNKTNGHRFSVQRWIDNKIVQESHFYKVDD